MGEKRISVVLGGIDHRLTRAEWRAVQARANEQLGDTEECPVHEYQSHGREAEELRKGIEDALGLDPEDVDDELRRLLDSVDARDSLAYEERRAAWKVVRVDYQIRDRRSNLVVGVHKSRAAAKRHRTKGLSRIVKVTTRRRKKP